MNQINLIPREYINHIAGDKILALHSLILARIEEDCLHGVKRVKRVRLQIKESQFPHRFRMLR